MMIPRALAPRRAWAGLAIATLVASAPAQNTTPRPRPTAITGVRLEPGEDAPTRTLLLRDGRIESIQYPGDAVPADAWLIDGKGMIAVPGFVDAWLRAEPGGERKTDQDAPVDVTGNVRIDMRRANRKGIHPSYRAADALSLTDAKTDAHRKHGFGVALVAPTGQLLAGRSTVVTLRDAAPRDLVVLGERFQHAAFSARGGGYPGTLMAHHAQLRQFFLDAAHHTLLQDRWATGKSGPRPAWDADLVEGAALLAGAPVVCEARTARDIDRWLRLADEIGFEVVAFLGGRDAGKRADVLAERGIAVVLDLDWGDEIEDPAAEEEEAEEEEEDEGEGEGESEEEESEDASTESSYEYTEPMGVRIEKRRLWEERRDTALRLFEAGVLVVFGSGDDKPADLLKRVRTLVEVGLPRDAALAALSAHPAEFLGVDRHYGWLRQGGSATLSLWTDDPLSEKAQVAWSFVDGFASEFKIKEAKKAREGGEPALGETLTGTWNVTVSGDDEDHPMTITLEMAEDGSVEGTVVTPSPMDESELTADVAGGLSGTDVTLSMTFSVAGMEVEMSLEGKLEGDAISGTSVLSMAGNEQESAFEAVRKPGGIR